MFLLSLPWMVGNGFISLMAYQAKGYAYIGP